jgi:tetratricopeptide (TPR) repeat protein
MESVLERMKRALFGDPRSPASGEPVTALRDVVAPPRVFRTSAAELLSTVRERYASGAFEEARNLARDALVDTAPLAIRTRAELELMLAHTERALRRFPEARNAADRALALRDSYDGHVAVAIAHKNLGDLGLARRHVRRARDLRPRSATLALIDAGYAFLAGAQLDPADEFDDVVAQIQDRALELESEFGWNINVAWYWAAVDDRDRCVRHLRDMVRSLGPRQKWWLADYVGHETDFDKWRSDRDVQEILTSCEGA